MHLWIRRFFVLIALMFWQGGFTFYASVVVPIGQGTFGPIEQGLLTRQVTNYLNLAGFVAVLFFGWELYFSQDASLWRKRCRWGLLAVILGLLAVLIGLHRRLDALLDIEAVDILDRRAFRHDHRIYLWVSTIQWTCCVLFAGLTLRSWRAEDTMTSRKE
jgi:hypothetical protein